MNTQLKAKMGWHGGQNLLMHRAKVWGRPSAFRFCWIQVLQAHGLNSAFPHLLVLLFCAVASLLVTYLLALA